MFILLTTYLNDWLTNSMDKSPWEAVTHLVKKFPAFYGTQRFITMLTKAHHQYLSWAKRIWSTLSHPMSLRPILILTYLHLDLPNDLFTSGFPTKILYAYLISAGTQRFFFVMWRSLSQIHSTEIIYIYIQPSELPTWSVHTNRFQWTSFVTLPVTSNLFLPSAISSHINRYL